VTIRDLRPDELDFLGDMKAMHELLRANGVARVALSVDLDNPAKRVYDRAGHRDVEPGDSKGLMLLEL
jgi:hypothetical protein